MVWSIAIIGVLLIAIMTIGNAAPYKQVFRDVSLKKEKILLKALLKTRSSKQPHAVSHDKFEDRRAIELLSINTSLPQDELISAMKMNDQQILSEKLTKKNLLKLKLSSFGWSSFDWSSFDWSSFDWSSFDWSSFDWFSFDLSSFDLSSFDWSSFDWSSFDWFSFDRSSFDLSSFDLSSFDLSSFDWSSFDRSSFDWSSFDWFDFNWSHEINWTSFDWSISEWSFFNVEWSDIDLLGWSRDRTFNRPDFSVDDSSTMSESSSFEWNVDHAKQQ